MWLLQQYQTGLSFFRAWMDGWSISIKKWQGLIPYLLKQPDKDDDELVIVASIESLAVIFENGNRT